jgi:cation diffusion facilitator CzcD-associated flavoprotein CzcO
VCGAGTAGLASAAALRAAGAEVVVLEQTDRVGASWRTRYDDLRLNTPGWMSTQPNAWAMALAESLRAQLSRAARRARSRRSV